MTGGRTVIALIGLLAAACGNTPQGYFPLEQGLEWEYDVVTRTRAGEQRGSYSVRNLGRRRIGEQVVYVRRTSSGTDYYLASDDTGIYRIAKRTIVERTPRRDADRRYVLRFPIATDSEWVSASHPYVLRRVHPYEETLSRGIQFKMFYRVDADNDTVTVPAGRFEHCVTVRGEGLVTVYSDAVQGFTEIPITTREWYAPGVGLVRLERTETLDTDVFTGGTLILSLRRYDF